MMNAVWGLMLVIGLALGVATGRGGEMADAMVSGAGDAVTLCLSLAGAYMLWMGLMNVAREAGLVDKLSRLIRPAMKRIFPNSAPAVAPITLNMAANFFGLGSAATPFGLEAMREMARLNPDKGRATDDMCMFLTLNASAIELLPANVIALRVAMGSGDPYGVILPTLLSSLIGFVAAYASCRLLAPLFR